MMPVKSIIRTIGVYLVCVAGIAAGIYFSIAIYGQKTFHLEKKQWRPAAPETQHIDLARLNKALEYIDTRLPTARSLLLLRNDKTVVEKYYWHGGPKVADYLHSLNLPLLQVLIGIAIDRQLIKGPEQPLSDFFQKQLQTLSVRPPSPTLKHLLRTQAPLLWGSGSQGYWKLFYAQDRVGASLKVLFEQQADIRSAKSFAAAYLLSRVIEQVSGQSVFNYAYRYLFHPLGITTYAAESDDLSYDPMVGFQLRALDLAKIGFLLSKEGSWEGRQIVSKDWVRWLLSDAAHADFDHSTGGSWAKTTIGHHESWVARGEGGQYLALVPALRVVVVTTSTSRFALPQDNGHERLLKLLLEAVMETPDTAALAANAKYKSEKLSEQYTDRLSPNFVFSTQVPQDILDFFHQFALDIVSKDTRRIAENYARAYDHSRDTFASPSRLMFGGGGSPPHLEYVHITKIRVENNRAYLRGNLKFAFRSYAGSQGIFPLENLIKLKGRWRWLGLPVKTALLDRDDYFDAELSEAQQQFADDCFGALIGKSGRIESDCFADDFQLAGGGRDLFVERLRPFLEGRSGVLLHITGLQRNSSAYRVHGYIEGSALGDIGLPSDLHIVKENGGWKWKGIVEAEPPK